MRARGCDSPGLLDQVIATATRGGQVQRLEARHRVHARVEGFIRCGKDTGLARWPSHSFAINTAWVTAAALAIDLLCWMRLLLLDGPLAKAEPATLRYRLLHAAARLVKRSRYLILRVPKNLALGTGIRRRCQPRPRHPLTRGPLSNRPQGRSSQPGTEEPGVTARHAATAPTVPPESKPNPPDRRSSAMNSGNREILRLASGNLGEPNAIISRGCVGVR